MDKEKLLMLFDSFKLRYYSKVITYILEEYPVEECKITNKSGIIIVNMRGVTFELIRTLRIEVSMPISYFELYRNDFKRLDTEIRHMHYELCFSIIKQDDNYYTDNDIFYNLDCDNYITANKRMLRCSSKYYKIPRIDTKMKSSRKS